MPGRPGARGSKRRDMDRRDMDRRGTLASGFGRAPSARPGEKTPPPWGAYDREFTPPGRLSLPSIPIATPQQAWESGGWPDGYDDDDDGAAAYRGYDNGDRRDSRPYHEAYDERAEDGWSGANSGRLGPNDAASDGWGDEDWSQLPTSRSRERSLARPLTAPPTAQAQRAPVSAPRRDRSDPRLQRAPVSAPRRERSDPRMQLIPVPPVVELSQASAPDLIAYRPPQPRVRRATERIMQSARNPWNMARLILALAAVVIGFLHAPLRMGEPSQPLQVEQAQMSLLAGASITSQVRPETQLKRPDLYDSYSQFQQWGGAACSAAALSEVLTAYGVRGATIGHEIDELGGNISPNWGLVDRHAFATIAAMHGLRADESTSWTYNQMVYVSQQLGIPVIVNVRISYGYYSFFSGGHFLVVVGGDSQGLAIVDSSEYYIHYLPKDVFYQMFTGYTAAIAPAGDQYNLPSN